MLTLEYIPIKITFKQLEETYKSADSEMLLFGYYKIT